MINVLLADDHPVVLEGLRQTISDAVGIAVVGEARSGTEAICQARTLAPDVLVLDLTMPGRGGLEVLRQLGAERPALPVLILSMHLEELYAARVLRAGAAGYLSKVEAPWKVVEAIRIVATGQRYFSKCIAQELAVSAEPSHVQKPHERLSTRELQVMLLLARGSSTREIAAALSISASTVRTYRRRVYDKTGARNGADLTRYATYERLLE